MLKKNENVKYLLLDYCSSKFNNLIFSNQYSTIRLQNDIMLGYLDINHKKFIACVLYTFFWIKKEKFFIRKVKYMPKLNFYSCLLTISPSIHHLTIVANFPHRFLLLLMRLWLIICLIKLF